MLLNALSIPRSIKGNAGSWSDTDVVEKIFDSQEIGRDNLLGSFQLWFSMRSYSDTLSLIFRSPGTHLKYETMFSHLRLSQCPPPISRSWALLCHHVKNLVLGETAYDNYKCQGGCGNKKELLTWYREKSLTADSTGVSQQRGWYLNENDGGSTNSRCRQGSASSMQFTQHSLHGGGEWLITGVQSSHWVDGWMDGSMDGRMTEWVTRWSSREI